MLYLPCTSSADGNVGPIMQRELCVLQGCHICEIHQKAAVAARESCRKLSLDVVKSHIRLKVSCLAVDGGLMKVALYEADGCHVD